MLVIHGDKDYRVPVGEALRMYADLVGRGRPRDEVPVLPGREPLDPEPGHAVIWYQTVLAFLATHLLGEPWQRPDLL